MASPCKGPENREEGRQKWIQFKTSSRRFKFEGEKSRKEKKIRKEMERKYKNKKRKEKKRKEKQATRLFPRIFAVLRRSDFASGWTAGPWGRKTKGEGGRRPRYNRSLGGAKNLKKSFSDVNLNFESNETSPRLLRSLVWEI